MGYQLQYSCFSAGKQSTCNAGDLGSIPGLGRSPGAGNGNPLQCSCLGNPMDRGAWQPIVHGVTKESDTAEQLGMQHACTPYQASTGHWREGWEWTGHRPCSQKPHSREKARDASEGHCKVRSSLRGRNKLVGGTKAGIAEVLGKNQENFMQEVTSEVRPKGMHVVEKAEGQKMRNAKREL